MPYISVTTNASLNKEQKNEIKSILGKLITVIPGKSEASLMVGVVDGASMAFKGKDIPCAYIEATCYGAVSRDAKEEFTKQAAQALGDIMGISPSNTYLTFTEKDCWGMGGTLV